MQQLTEMALTAVNVALSRFIEFFSTAPWWVDNKHVEELVRELTWMQCFFLEGEITAQGRLRTDVWSLAIERLAVCAQQICPDDDDIISDINNRFACLRIKINPFLTPPQIPSSDSANIPDPVAAIKLPKKLKMAAWGGPGGKEWKYKPKGSIKQITIVYGEVIDSLTFTTLKPDLTVETSKRVGGKGGDKTKKVNIDGKCEYLTGLFGTYGSYNNMIVLRSIKFQTNKKMYGQYGSTNGTPFYFVLENGGKMVGFHGCFGGYLDAIGVHYQP